MDGQSLGKLAGRCRMPLGTPEKDRALTSLPSATAGFPKPDGMVFGGGAALKKTHSEDFRFSEDLGFALKASQMILRAL